MISNTTASTSWYFVDLLYTSLFCFVLFSFFVFLFFKIAPKWKVCHSLLVMQRRNKWQRFFLQSFFLLSLWTCRFFKLTFLGWGKHWQLWNILVCQKNSGVVQSHYNCQVRVIIMAVFGESAFLTERPLVSPYPGSKCHIHWVHANACSLKPCFSYWLNPWKLISLL